MQRIGTVAELWRYPVKSMRGERLAKAAFDASGMVGDRRYAVVSTAAPLGKPLLTSRERTRMLLYAPQLDPTPLVVTPAGERVALPSPELVEVLQHELAAPGATLALEHSPDTPLTDVRALSFISRSTLRALSEGMGCEVDPQRLRSNLILALDEDRPYVEEGLEGRYLRFGNGVDGPVFRVHERVPRCRMVTLDPVTAEADPALLRYLARHRDGRIAMYASVDRPGTMEQGAVIYVVDRA